MKSLIFSLILVLISFLNMGALRAETTVAAAGSVANLPSEAVDVAKEIGVDLNAVDPAPAVIAAPTTAVAIEKAAVKKSDLKENEIMVNTQVHKASGGDSFWGRAFGAFAILGAMIFGAWLLIRRTKGKNSFLKQAPQIKVLGQHHLGPRKSLAIIRVAGESILIGVTDHNISMIKSLSLLDEEVPHDVPTSFDHILGGASANGGVSTFGGAAIKRSNAKIASAASVAGYFSGSDQGLDEDAADENEAAEDFSIKGIRDFVSGRLKNMRSLE